MVENEWGSCGIEWIEFEFLIELPGVCLKLCLILRSKVVSKIVSKFILEMLMFITIGLCCVFSRT